MRLRSLAVVLCAASVLAGLPRAALAHRLLSDQPEPPGDQPANKIVNGASVAASQVEDGSDAAAPISTVAGASYKVVNGETPTRQQQNRFRYQLGFEPRQTTRGGTMCGASLIRPDVALTAAHCLPAQLDEESLRGMRIYAGGIINWLSPKTDATEYGVRGAMRHPAYNPRTSRNDLALVFLDQCVTLGPDVEPIAIATPEEFAAAANSTWMVSGWGTTEYGADPNYGQDGQLPALLQYAHVKYVQPSVCEAELARTAGLRSGSSVFDDTTAMCAGLVPGASPSSTRTPMQDACQGDSGGPLVFNLGDRTAPEDGSPDQDRVVGVVSWGIGCGKYGAPSIYTFLPAYRGWIQAQLAANPAPCGAAGGSPAPAAAAPVAGAADTAGTVDDGADVYDPSAGDGDVTGDVTGDTAQQQPQDDPALEGIDNWFDFIAAIIRGAGQQGVPASASPNAPLSQTARPIGGGDTGGLIVASSPALVGHTEPPPARGQPVASGAGGRLARCLTPGVAAAAAAALLLA